jgi:hypothetical protein
MGRGRGPARRVPGGGGGERSGDTGTSAAEAGTGQAMRQCVQGGNRGGRAWAGPGKKKGKWAGPNGIVNFFIYSNNFQTSLNCFDQKVDVSSSKNFK